MRRSLSAVVLLAIGGTMTGAVGASRACVPLRSVVSIAPRSSGPPGMELQVSGAGFGNETLEVRWNGLDGPKLATAKGPDFVVTARVPEVGAGLYSVMVLARAVDGGVENADHAAFLVTAAGSDPGQAVGRPSASTATTAGAGSSGSTGDESAGTRWLLPASLFVVGAIFGAAFTGRRKRTEPPRPLPPEAAEEPSAPQR